MFLEQKNTSFSSIQLNPSITSDGINFVCNRISPPPTKLDRFRLTNVETIRVVKHQVADDKSHDNPYRPKGHKVCLDGWGSED